MLTGIAIGLIIACGIPVVLSVIAEFMAISTTSFEWDAYFPVGICIVIMSGAIGFLVGGV